MGAWAATTAYALDDVVTTSGKTYICILGYTSGASFAVGSNWSLMAEKGTDGTTVGVGTAGQVLKTKSDLSGTEWGADLGGKVLQHKYFELVASGGGAVNTTATSPVLVGSAVGFTPSKSGSRLEVHLVNDGYEDRGNINLAGMHRSIVINSTNGELFIGSGALLRSQPMIPYGSGVDHSRPVYTVSSTYLTTSTASMTLRAYYWSEQGRNVHFHKSELGKPSYFTITEYDV
jgi:hypothetical protein